MSVRRSLLPVGAFTACYVLISLVAAIAMENWEFVFYVNTLLLITLLVVLVHRRMHFSPALLWMLSVWGLLHMAGGLVHVPLSWPINGDQNVLYSLWLLPHHLLKYDNVVHAYGFGVATWLCWQMLHRLLSKSLPTARVLLLCVLAGMGLGSLNETLEFFAWLLMPETNVGDYVNTSLDLVANMVGSIGAACLIWWLQEKRNENV